MRKSLLCLAVVLGLACLGQAALVATPNYETGAQSVSASDLINAGQPTLAGVETGGGMTYGSYAVLNDGSNVDFFCADNGNVDVRYILNTVANPYGFDIDQVDVFSQWGDSRVCQSFTVTAYFVDNSPASTTQNFLDTPPGADSLKVSLTDNTNQPVWSGVSSLLFNFYPIYGPGTALREIDVFGSPTVPEPATIGFLSVGLLGLIGRKK